MLEMSLKPMKTTNGFYEIPMIFTRLRSIHKTVTTTWVISEVVNRQYNGKTKQKQKQKQSKAKLNKTKQNKTNKQRQNDQQWSTIYYKEN